MSRVFLNPNITGEGISPAENRGITQMTDTGSITRQITHAGARITLNKAATDRFGGDASWLLLRKVSGHLHLKLALSAEHGSRGAQLALPLAARPRGGAEATLLLTSAPSGYLTAILSVLPQTQQRPYALLTPNSDGRITANNFDSDGDPPRAEPHLRMWWTQPASALPPAQQHNDDYPERVRQAATMLREAARRPGKLSNEVRAALNVMAEFEHLVREVLPDLLLPDLNPDDVRRAADTLLVLTDRVEKARIRRDKLSGST
jgi:hypothetical protein